MLKLVGLLAEMPLELDDRVLKLELDGNGEVLLKLDEELELDNSFELAESLIELLLELDDRILELVLELRLELEPRNFVVEEALEVVVDDEPNC